MQLREMIELNLEKQEVVIMTFGAKLQLLRKQKGMSQEQLASQLSISRQAISKWELDSSLPDTENVVQLSNLFEVSLDYLLKDEEQDKNETAKSSAKSKKVNYVYLSGISCLLLSSISFFVVWVLSKIYPAPIVFYNPVTEQWKVGLENFIWTHGLETFMFLVSTLFVIGIALMLHKQLMKLYTYVVFKFRKTK